MTNDLKSQVNVGMVVKTLDGKEVGKVTTLHGDTFEVEKGLFFKDDYSAAFSEIARIQGHDVFLSLSQKDLEAMRGKGGVGTAFSDRAAGVVDHAREAIDDAVHPAKTPKTGKA